VCIEQMMSIVPSATASTMARRSSSDRSGGLSLKKVRKSPTSSSLSVRWWIETPAVTSSPAAFARFSAGRAAAVDSWSAW
jgi:hypothetical protein